jgi:hypothetical protein
MKRSSEILLVLLAAFVLILSPACSGSGGSDAGGNPVGPDGSGTLRIRLTDKPAVDYTSVWVTVANVRVHQSAGTGTTEAGWIDMPVTAAMPVDLLTLRNGILLPLCGGQLPAGQYQQIRLVLTPNAGGPPYNNSVVTADGVDHPLEIPSDSIKIVHGIPVTDGSVTDVIIDFDGALSIKERGNGVYALQPVIKVSSTVQAP